MSLLIVLMFAITFISCVLSERKIQDQGAKLLTQQELVEIFSNELSVSFNTKSGTADGIYSPDGTQKIMWSGGGDEGSYKINNGLFCSKWDNTRGGKEECYKIYQTTDNKYIWFKLNGSYDSEMVIK